MNYKNNDIVYIKYINDQILIIDYCKEKPAESKMCANALMQIFNYDGVDEISFTNTYREFNTSGAIEIRFATQKEIEKFNFYKEHRFVFDLHSFDKVLVRNQKHDKWQINFFSHYTEDGSFPYFCMTGSFKQCIKYTENTKKLLNTNYDI